MKKRLLSYLLATTILFSSAGCKKKEQKTSNIIENYIQNTININQIKPYLNQIEDIEVTYNHELYYFDDEDYKKLQKAINSYISCSNKETYTLIKIYLTILKNSNLMSNLSDKEENLKSALDKALNKIYSNNDNINDDFCKLKDIRIQIGSLEDNVLGQYNNDNLIITIDYDKVKNEYRKQLKRELTFIEYFSNVVEHELNHVRQYICNCRKNDGQLNNKITYNDASCTLIEASAESQLYNNYIYEIKKKQLSSFNYTYYNARAGQALILLLGLFKDNFSIDEYYDAINETNLKKFHNLFKLETKEDFLTFYKIKYAIDTLNYRTELYDYYKYSGYETIGEIKEQTGNDYKIDIFKIVISDLMKEIGRKDLTYEESINLYNFVKSIIIDEEEAYEEINGRDVCVYNERFLHSIKNIDEIFYEYLSQCFKKDKTEIIETNKDYKKLSILDHILDFSSIEYIYNQESYDIASSLIEKYPLISEITFCINAHSFYLRDFLTASENDYTKEKTLK